MTSKIKKTTSLSALLAILIGLTITACKKGDTGPAGPAGANGTNGVANIQTSSVTTSNNSWTFDNTDNSYNATLTYAAITQAVIDRGTVQVFLGNGNGTEWAALPFAYGIVQYNYSYKVGQVFLTITLSTGLAPNNPGGQQFKVVVIPPASKSPNASAADNEKKEAIFTIN